MKLKRILVPVDFSETSEIATNNAMTLAKLLKADVFLIYVIENNWFNYSEILDQQIVAPKLIDFEKAIEGKMYNIQKRLIKDFGFKPDIYITTGQIHIEIIKYSEKNEIDLIVMGTHGVSGYDELFLGSNAQRVVTLSEVPVLTMQKTCHKVEFKNILIPIDNSMHSREKVNLAVTIANLFSSKIHLIGLTNSKEKQDLDKFKIKLESVESVLNTNNLKYKTIIVHGENLAKEAIRYATKNKCDLIIITTGHESKINDVFLNAFAQQIVNHSKIPVLSFKHIEGNYSNGAAGFPGF